MDNCELDKEIFHCHECTFPFNHTEGTWLPTSRYIDLDYCTVLPKGSDIRFKEAIPVWFSLKQPRIETSDEFICYQCL